MSDMENFETYVRKTLDTLVDEVESLNRTVRGTDVEGNRGLLKRLRDTNAEQAENSQRISTLERRNVRLSAYVTGAAAAGGFVGGAVTVALSLADLWSGQ